MRAEDFSIRIKKEALKRANFRCERCWHNNDLEYHHKVPLTLGGKSDIDNCVVLCSNCHWNAPGDPILFEKMYLRFASTKEMICYYGVKTEDEAVRAWCEELGYEIKDIIEQIKKNYPSHRDLVKERMKTKAKEGKILGFNIPYGYDYKDGKLIVNPKEGVTVKIIFEKYLHGLGMGRIVEQLNEKDIPTKKGGRWAKQTISGILKNPLYCGFIQWEEILKKGEHDSIVDTMIFNKVQQLIIQKVKNPSQKSGHRVVILSK